MPKELPNAIDSKLALSYHESMFHHARELNFVDHGFAVGKKVSEATQKPPCIKDKHGNCELDDWHMAKELWEPCYEWLEARVGFYPVFLAVGNTDRDIYMTGYPNQWAKWAKGSNQVLFSFKTLDNIVYTDYDLWHVVLNSTYKLDTHEFGIREVGPGAEKQIFKPSWNHSKWKSKAKKYPHSVQAVTETLDLRAADQIRVRSKATKQALIQKGFDEEKIEVFRLPVEITWE